MNNDFQQKIREELFSTADETPDSLSRENITNLVRNRDQKAAKASPSVKRVIAIAASFAIVFVAAFGGAKIYGRQNKLNKAAKQSQVPGVRSDVSGQVALGVSTASYEDIQGFFINLKNSIVSGGYNGRVTARNFFGSSMDDGAVPEAFAEYNTAAKAAENTVSSSAEGDGMGSGPASQTELQVEGVDEADIVKTDGKYLYVVKQSDTKKILVIDPTDRNNIRILSEIELVSDAGYSSFAQDFYIKGNKIIAVVNVYKDSSEDDRNGIFYGCMGSGFTKTGVQIFDITDRSAPKKVAVYDVDGGYVSSRMIDDSIILISNYVVPIYENEETLKDKCIPKYRVNSEEFNVPADKISIIEGNSENTYTLVLKINTADASSKPESAAVLGGSSDVYCNSTDLYLARFEYTETVREFRADTFIYRFELANLNYKASVKVKGNILNQFSMDEYNGYFRIATCDTNEQSYITVLDKQLNQVGFLGGIAKGESIYAVRFIGDKAYVVSFFQTDPLFIIDLSEPTAPKVVGELKIPGFSSMLYPYGDNYLIGIGIDGDDEGTNGMLKISLFDISDKNNPREVSKAVIPGYVDSPAMHDHKAFMRISDNEFIIPVEGDKPYLCSFKVENGEITQYKKYICSTDERDYYNYLERGAYIGNTVFAITSNAIEAFDMDSAQSLSIIRISNPDENRDDIIVYNTEENSASVIYD